MKPHESLVTFESMLIGYTDAVARLEAGTGDTTTTYVSLFEALNWAVALDHRVGAHGCQTSSLSASSGAHGSDTVPS